MQIGGDICALTYCYHSYVLATCKMLSSPLLFSKFEFEFDFVFRLARDDWPMCQCIYSFVIV